MEDCRRRHPTRLTRESAEKVAGSFRAMRQLAEFPDSGMSARCEGRTFCLLIHQRIFTRLAKAGQVVRRLQGPAR